MYPLLLKPAYKDYIWGGERLKKQFGKICDSNTVAESWEVSCHKDGLCIIDNGIYKNTSLKEYITNSKKDVLGTNCRQFNDFPFLIKLIDAKDNLSVQVHPSDEYALSNEGQYGKTEMWYVIDCDSNSKLICGFENDTTKEKVKKSIEDNTLLDIVHTADVKKGDVFFIKSGTIHAIGKGILIAEIQQNSNCTYRVFDYNRLGKDGLPRQLHIDKALEVLDYNKYTSYENSKEKKYNGYTIKELSSCRYFSSKLINCEKECRLYADSKSFHTILLLSGNCEIVAPDFRSTLKAGQSVFIPASFGVYILKGIFNAIETLVP